MLGAAPCVAASSMRRSISAGGKLSLPYGLPWLRMYGSLKATRWLVVAQM